MRFWCSTVFRRLAARNGAQPARLARGFILVAGMVVPAVITLATIDGLITTLWRVTLVESDLKEQSMKVRDLYEARGKTIRHRIFLLLIAAQDEDLVSAKQREKIGEVVDRGFAEGNVAWRHRPLDILIGQRAAEEIRQGGGAPDMPVSVPADTGRSGTSR